MSTQQAQTALLVMDMQEMILQSLPDAATLVANTSAAIAAARANNIPVIYVVVGFRQNLDEINPNNKVFAGFGQQLANIDMEQWKKIHTDLAPSEKEVVVVKKRFSAFAGSDLEIVLRSKGIQHLVLTGVVTSGVVLSTALEAADKDYQLTILADACQDRDEEVHQLLVEKLFPRYATVTTVAEWIK